MQRPSLSVTYVAMEDPPVPEPEPIPEPPKRRGRPPGTKNAAKPQPKKPLPWFTIWRAVFWATVSLISVVSLYRGVEGWLGQNIAYIVLAVSVLIAGFLLDRDWKRMKSSGAL